MKLKVTSEDTLRNAIAALEAEEKTVTNHLRSQAGQLYESVQPLNLIKGTVREIGASKELKEKFVALAVGLAAGHAARFIYQKTSKSPFRKFVGPLLQFAITNFVAGKPETIQKLGSHAVRAVQLVTSEVSEESQ